MANIIGTVKGLSYSAQASEALAKGTAVAIDFATDAASYPASAGGKTFGIVTKDYDSGDMAEVFFTGLVPAVVSTAAGVAVGDKLTAGTDGKLAEATTGNIAIAEALQVPVADNDQILVRLIDPVTV